MAQTVDIQGTITTGDGICSPSGQVNQCVRALLLGGACAGVGLQYESTLVTRITVATAGAVGAAFVAIPALQQFTAIEFLYLLSNAQVQLRYTLPDASTTVTPNLTGLQISQFSRSTLAPTAVEVSGTATIDIIAAGRVSA